MSSEAKVFTDIQASRHKTGEIGERQLRKLRRAATLLSDCMEGKDLEWKSAVFPAKVLGEGFADVLSEYGSSLLPFLASGTIQGVLSMVRQFLFFLEASGLSDFILMTAIHVKLFMQDIAEKRKNAMADLAWALQRFLAFLREKNLSAINADIYLVRPAPRKKKVLPCFTDQEVGAILAAIDATTSLGKRDYAIVLLAAETGLRLADILELKLNDINWNKSEIAVIQSKTGEPIHLPLAAGVGNAIADYILHSRQKSDSPHIFLRSVRPYARLGCVGGGKNIINRYLGKAGVRHEAFDGKTFHAFRRTQGTRLVEAGVPLPETAEMLGQKDINSPKRYISLNNGKMRACCLDISEYATRKDGLA
jgi:integrase